MLPQFDLAAASTALAAASAAHLRARGVAAKVVTHAGPSFPAARVVRQQGEGATTVIIPTRNRLPLLKKCLTSIAPAMRGARASIVVIDNDSTDSATLAYLDEIDGSIAKVKRIAGPFNFARLNNIAVAAADSEFVCLLNNDLEACDAFWLGEMLGRAAPADVGAVGALLVYPSGIVQHGGVVLGPNFAATHAFNDRMADDPGYGDLLLVARECSAVTAACLLTRRADYLAVGGMDEVRLPINFNDVDYCLKLRASGKRIIWTPYARLIHVESASRGGEARTDRARLYERELRLLRLRWGNALIDDPYYSPVLSLDPIPFSALASPVRRMEPRTGRKPVAADVPPGC